MRAFVNKAVSFDSRNEVTISTEFLHSWCIMFAYKGEASIVSGCLDVIQSRYASQAEESAAEKSDACRRPLH